MAKKKKKIHKDKNGREFIKEPYFVGGKMKFKRIYVIDGIPVDEFYLNNATDWDFYLNGDYELMEMDFNTHSDVEKSDNENDIDVDGIPF